MALSLEPRGEVSLALNLSLPVVAVAASLLLCSGLIAIAGADPFGAYLILFDASFGSYQQVAETLLRAGPLLLTGLAAAVAFRARFWNIGGEGQLLAGAMAAAFFGAAESLPGWTLIPAMIIGGFFAGALCATVAAWLKTALKVDEVVGTLMLNFIIYYGMMALLDGPWKDPFSGWPDSPDIVAAAELPILVAGTRLHLGVAIAAAAAVAVWLLVRKTTLGFAIDAVGHNPLAAEHAGIAVRPTLLAAAAISGGLAGLAGVGEVGGVHFQVMSAISPGFGYIGIVVAMLARLHPLGVVPSAIFMAAVMSGADEMSRRTGVPAFLADVIQGVALLCMLIALVFANYRLRRRRPWTS